MSIKVTLSEDVLILARMIEGQKRSIVSAESRNESEEILGSLRFVLFDMQIQLSEILSETIRHEVRV